MILNTNVALDSVPEFAIQNASNSLESTKMWANVKVPLDE